MTHAHTNNSAKWMVLLVTSALLVACGGIAPVEESPAPLQPRAEIELNEVRSISPAVPAQVQRSSSAELAAAASTDSLRPVQSGDTRRPEPEYKKAQVLRIRQGGQMAISPREETREYLKNDFTLETWFRLASDPNQPTLADQTMLSAGKTRIEIKNRKVQASIGPYELSSFTIVADEWYHVALVRQAEMLTLYVNGISVAAVQWHSDMELPTGQMVVGGGTFSGKLDNLRLTTDALYGPRDFTPEQKMQALDSMIYGFDFDDEMNSSTAQDRGMHDNDGKLDGAAEVVAGAI